VSRWTTAANSLETGQPVFRRHQFAWLTSSGGVNTYLWDGYGVLFDGVNSYQGLGQFGSASEVREEADAFPRSVTLRINAIPNSVTPLFSAIKNEGLFNQEGSVSIGFLNLNERTLVSSLSERFYGRVGAIDGNISADDESWLSVTLDNPMRAPPKNGTYSTEDHQTAAVSSGDTLFEFLDQIATSPPAPWGDKVMGPSPGGSWPIPWNGPGRYGSGG
jgi:hypothetical protein